MSDNHISLSDFSPMFKWIGGGTLLSMLAAAFFYAFTAGQLFNNFQTLQRENELKEIRIDILEKQSAKDRIRDSETDIVWLNMAADICELTAKMNNEPNTLCRALRQRIYDKK